MKQTVSLAVLLAAGLSVTKSVDFVRNWLAQHLPNLVLPKYVWNLLPFAVGIFTCVQTKFNALVGLPLAAKVGETTGQVLTGLFFGGIAGFAHDPLDAASGIAKFLHAQANAVSAGGPIAENPAGGAPMPDGPPGTVAPAAPPAPPAG